MTKYKCGNPECKYVSDEPGDCCGNKLVEVTAPEEPKSE